MRLRALLAASAASGGVNSYAYELTITPDWHYDHGGYSSAHYDNYSEVFNLAKKMCLEIGVYIPDIYGYELLVVPSEFKIIVDGRRVCQMQYTPEFDSIYGIFEEGENFRNIEMDLSPEYIQLFAY